MATVVLDGAEPVEASAGPKVGVVTDSSRIESRLLEEPEEEAARCV
jgi:hypothetical protein